LIAKKEKRWVIWFALIVIVVTSLPYLWGFIRQGTDWRYTGLLIGTEDGNSYLAKMLLGSHGDWLFRTPYTPFQQTGFLAFLPYYLLGKLTWGPNQHFQIVALFHLFRFAAGFLSILATYDFLAVFVQDVKLRRIGVALATLGGGLAFLSLLGLNQLWGGRLPLEFYSPETFGFLEIFSLPHLALGRAFFLWGLRKYLLDQQNNEWATRLIAGVFWLGLGFMQPLTVVVGWVILGVHLLSIAIWNWIRHSKDWGTWWVHFWRAFWMVIISAPLVLYTFISFKIDPFLRGWESQNIIKSPPFGDYLLAFGVILPLVVIGVVKTLKTINERSILLVGWIAIFPLLAYAPYNLQRRLPEGIWAALIVIAMIGLLSLVGKLRKVAQVWLYFAFTPALILILGGFISANRVSLPLFRPEDETSAFTYLAEHADKGQIILAAYDTSNVLPTWAPLRVFIGHGPESIKLKEIRPRVEAFFQTSTEDSTRIELLNEFQVAYIIWGPQEKALGDWNPPSSSLVDLVYKNQTFDVYKVKSTLP
jgi:hypothetical protein